MLASRKAEASIEFMVFFGIIMVFFVFFLGIIGNNNNDIRTSTVFASAGNVLNVVVDEINTASRIQGYHREFVMPDVLSDEEPYNVTYNTSLRIVRVAWGGGYNVIGNIITSNVTGSFKSGYNRIENTQGGVVINAG
jgi:hypothetical protein